MTDTFTASNGTRVTLYPGAGAQVILEDGRAQPVSATALSALREAIRAEEDKRLGRWRWPENPDYVVYPVASPPAVAGMDVMVVSEKTGLSALFSRGASQGYPPAVTTSLTSAATAYFDAHPVEPPKPWHNAKEGEVWALTTEDYEGEHPYTVIPNSRGDWLHFERNEANFYDQDDRRITAGRRIWPEGD